MNTKIIVDPGLQAVFKELERRAARGETPWSKAGLAALIGVQKQAINNWSRVPAERVHLVAHILGLRKSVLRPDLFGRIENGRPVSEIAKAG